VPLLGVCLGHQTIAAALGGKVVRSAQPVHGRSSLIYHRGAGLFQGLPSPLRVGRYHSLVVDPAALPDELEVTAQTDDQTVMALAHRVFPVFGVQFHPESILTEGGFLLLANFLRLAGLEPGPWIPAIDEERPVPAEAAPLPDRPVTF
jgi:anthranilate synthase/aminodeoxychorismate synthase-like glutamine amidotransferase